jgi:hypothetical protein
MSAGPGHGREVAQGYEEEAETRRKANRLMVLEPYLHRVQPECGRDGLAAGHPPPPGSGLSRAARPLAGPKRPAGSQGDRRVNPKPPARCWVAMAGCRFAGGGPAQTGFTSAELAACSARGALRHRGDGQFFAGLHAITGTGVPPWTKRPMPSGRYCTRLGRFFCTLADWFSACHHAPSPLTITSTKVFKSN